MVVERSVDEVHTIAVVIPVYRGERTLETVVKELIPHTETLTTPDGHPYRVDEVVLVHDNGDDRSDDVMRSLARSIRSCGRSGWPATSASTRPRSRG